MEKRQIINIINFIRGCEPREPVDLLLPVRQQIRLMRRHGLRGTFLIQYDALTDPRFTELLRELDPGQFELGVWFEVVQPLTEKVGIPWRGRFPWDWHVHCGFSMGYPPEQRERLADELYARFYENFGYRPKVFGSWFFDSHTARYVSDKYGADAFCNCKEQYGTDGYTLWGGYYGQGYYPSRNNVFLPAQSEDAQLPVPLFRMLGSDPVYQYDFGMQPDSGAPAVQGVITLEPVYTGQGGGDPAWVDWYLRENFNGECLSFGYAQAGQENSFGWSAMEKGLEYQFARFARLQAEGRLTVEPLGETGRWYKKTYPVTPASMITAHSAYDDGGKRSVWYCSRYYRVNVYADDKGLRIRDLHIFREDLPDPFGDTVCTGNAAVYESLPVMDGNLYTGHGILAGAWLLGADGKPLSGGDLHFTETGPGSAQIRCGDVRIELAERGLTVTGEAGLTVDSRIGSSDRHFPRTVSRDAHTLRLCYGGMEYGILLTAGHFDGPGRIRSEKGTVGLTVF